MKTILALAFFIAVTAAASVDNVSILTFFVNTSKESQEEKEIYFTF